VMPNMLWGAQAHYPSDILPRSKTFDEFGDQLEQCVAAGKKNGIEVHVWKVNFNIGYGVPQEYIDQLRKEDRLQVSVDGEDGNWLNPAHPKNFQMELDSILEVVRKYDIDGFHFDYIRYPDSRHDFSEYSRKKFEADTGHAVKNWPADCYDGPLLEAYTDWRCGNITHLVKAVSEQARMIRPGIKISAAVFRDYPNCRKWVAQDWPLWAKEGYVDFLCPMDYTDDDEQYIDWITSQKSLLPDGFPLYPGIGISLRNKTQSIDRVVGQIFLNRKVGTGGFTIFDMNKTTLQSVANGLSKSSGKSKSIPPHHKRD
ncbi:MAG: family 10 glycosylhydrolase, partial [Verrucomicrobiales bacterium]|nr:family 10 glycosylhydrolase [Verrucomicrobiales bacterium]